MSPAHSEEITTTDYLVIGSGIAGLTFAIKMAARYPEKTVTVVTKSTTLESNTRHAQGGIAVVTNTESDSFEQHIQDTLLAGDGLCNEQAVRTIINQGPARLQELIEWGAHFDVEAGRIVLGREGGHTANRIVHCGDKTGKELSDVLLQRITSLPNVRLLKGCMAVDLMTTKEGCTGAYVTDKQQRITTLCSSVTVLATGGIGRVYSNTTNPHIATGDGIAMAQRAGVRISGMAFIQFHPTALFHSALQAPFLISEAVRGAGARLMNARGAYFMESYHPQKDLAPRDVVSRAVFAEMQQTGSDCVFLDCTTISPTDMERQFPTISEKCRSLNLDLRTTPIPVKPAAHYLCGGIETDLTGATSLPYLYALGECANTGLHGANRLASNSLLEALVMAHQCCQAVAPPHEREPVAQVVKHPPLGTTSFSELRVELQELMQAHAAIIRSNSGLQQTLHRLQQMAAIVETAYFTQQLSLAGLEVRNMVHVAILIVSQSLAQQTNVGGYYNTDLVSQTLSEANHSA